MHSGLLESPAVLRCGGGGWELLSSPAAWRSPEVQGRWRELVASAGHLHAAFQSPDWFEHMHSARRSCEQLRLAVYADGAGGVRGLAPLALSRYSLRFPVAPGATWALRLRALYVLGSAPLAPEDEGLYDSLFAALPRAFPRCHCVALDAVPGDGFLWDYLARSRVVRDAFLPYAVGGLRRYDVLPLPATFEEYLGRFSRKRRYNLGRQARLLGRETGRPVELQRVTARGQVAAYLDAKAALSGPSPRRATEERLLGDLADRGWLRCYVLRVGDTPAGCLEGFQYGGVYHLDQTLYGAEFGRFSPGAVLLYLAVQDLLTHEPARTINFGFGEPAYRYSSCNVSHQYASVLLFRRGAAGWLCRGAHAAAGWSVRSLKALLRRPA